MARQIIFHKYQGTENGFLIYDIRKNGGEMNDGLLHMIRSRNFGLDLDGILVAAVSGRWQSGDEDVRPPGT